MIQLRNVTKYYDVNGQRKYILRNVNLTIPPGTNVGILGRNGAGKSTFLRMLGNIDFPNQGKIISTKAFSWPMGLTGTFQGSLTGRENTQFVCRIYSKSIEEQKRTLAFVEAFSELGRYFKMPVKTYSTGMKARLGFSLSLAFDFDYYLIDETLSVGDPMFRKKCADALKDINSQRNILLVAHNAKVLEEMCTTGVVLEAGQLTYFEHIKAAVRVYNQLLRPIAKGKAKQEICLAN